MYLAKPNIGAVLLLLEILLYDTLAKSISRKKKFQNNNNSAVVEHHSTFKMVGNHSAHELPNRKRRNSAREDENNYAAYFSGKEVIRYSQVNLNFDHFTITFWMSAEGGQGTETPIIRIYNHCSFLDLTSVTIGLKTVNRDVLVYFLMKTRNSKQITTLTSHENIPILTWIHVAAVYDGHTMSLYVNQAKVDVSLEQTGVFLSSVYPKCTTLEVGGNHEKHETFRGFLDKIVMINKPLDHRAISKSIRNITFTETELILQEDFPLHSQRYHGIFEMLPEKIKSKIHIVNGKKVELEIPKCGFTVCDNPEVIQNYASHPSVYLRPKTIHYRVVLLTDDMGENSFLSIKDIQQKHLELSEIFKKYNILQRVTLTEVKSSYLLNKTVLMSCYRPCPDDSVDCQQTIPVNPEKCQQKCTADKLSNRQCDVECNNPDGSNNWDRGDCCNPNLTNVTETCYDKKSHYRAFIEERELKKYLNFTNHDYLTIYPVRLPMNFLGKSTYPWTESIYGLYGGITMNYESFKLNPKGNVNDIVHEMAHSLGLWHVHRGVSEVACTDACAEEFLSMTTGDLCSDTSPTPTNYKCQDEVAYEKNCNGVNETIKYVNTPFKNYMGYVSGTCANQFTKQQQARMHCYLDSHYQRWQTSSVAPSPIPLKPQVVSYTDKKLQLIWHAPVGNGYQYHHQDCQQCDQNSRLLHQYVHKVFVNGQSVNDNKDYSPSRVVGPPDVEIKCQADRNLWIARGRHVIEVAFKMAVVPIALKIWISFKAENAIVDIKLIHTDNTSTSLGPASTNCLVPFTRRIKTNKPMGRLQIILRKNLVGRPAGIDAILVTSEKNYPQSCSKCSQLHLQYNIHRSPPFKKVNFETTTKLNFIDKGIEDGKTYTYRIQAVSNGTRSQLSLPLFFRNTDGFCGNGIVERHLGEECDDANLRDGDGCNIGCKVEVIFNCKLQPSLCYRYDRDGVCEDSERVHETRDCGLYTPNDYIDQWSTQIFGREYQSDSTCPENVMTGTPSTNMKCVDGFEMVDPSQAWRPCNGYHPITGQIFEHVWIEAAFKRSVFAVAVIIHLASDGRFGTENETMTVKLIDNDGKHRKVTQKVTQVNCDANPIIVETKEMKDRFSTTRVRLEFAMGYIGIAAIALRSGRAKKCQVGEIYNPKNQKCERSKEEILPCPKLNMKNAHTLCSKDGQSCTLKCHKGYARSNDLPALCDHGTWRNGEDCIIKNCELPKIENAFVSCPKKSYGSVCSFNCTGGSLLHGTDRTITCQQNGRWTVQNSFCYKYCSTKPFVTNAVPHSSQPDGCQMFGDKKYEMGIRCRLKCNSGFFPRRKKLQKNSKNVINSHCDDQGQWQYDGSCQRVECPKLSKYQELLYNCSNGNRYQSICRTSCLGTTDLHEVKCSSSGQWSKHIDVCKTEGHCSKFALRTKSNVSFAACTSTSIGSVCKPSCGMDDVVYQNPNSKPASNYEVVTHCMPNLKWLPQLTENTVKCEAKCYSRGIGDGYCDCENNRAYCLYDGGDCCGEIVRFLGTKTCGCQQ